MCQGRIGWVGLGVNAGRAKICRRLEFEEDAAALALAITIKYTFRINKLHTINALLSSPLIYPPSIRCCFARLLLSATRAHTTARASTADRIAARSRVTKHMLLAATRSAAATAAAACTRAARPLFLCRRLPRPDTPAPHRAMAGEGAFTYKWARPALTVDTAIVAAGEGAAPALLLIQRKNPPCKGQWALPGGFIDDGEDLEAAAARELKEETSLDAEDNVPFVQVRGGCIVGFQPPFADVPVVPTASCALLHPPRPDRPRAPRSAPLARPAATRAGGPSRSPTRRWCRRGPPRASRRRCVGGVRGRAGLPALDLLSSFDHC
jgi:hypothetical protein